MNNDDRERFDQLIDKIQVDNLTTIERREYDALCDQWEREQPRPREAYGCSSSTFPPILWESIR